MSTIRVEDFAALRDRLAGRSWSPAMSRGTRRAPRWNLTADQHPGRGRGGRVRRGHRGDRSLRLRQRVRRYRSGHGHGAAALTSRLDGVILIKTHEMRGVEIDPETRTARAQAGALWMDVTAPAHEHGLAALAGSSPDVGVVGYTLGGGLSWLSRTYGVAANSVTAIEVVTADGQIIRTDADNDPALFWALRGGGGSFGIVTAIEFTLYPVPRSTPASCSGRSSGRPRCCTRGTTWRRAAGVDDDRRPAADAAADPGDPGAAARTQVRAWSRPSTSATSARAPSCWQPLRQLGPEMDTAATIPTRALARCTWIPEHPVPGAGDGMLLSELRPTIDEIAGLGTRARSTPCCLSSCVSWAERSAVGRTGPGRGRPLRRRLRDVRVGIAPVPPAKIGRAGRVGTVMPLSSRTDRIPATSTSTSPDRRRGAVPAHRAPPAGELKRWYDPADMFRSNHSGRPRSQPSDSRRPVRQPDGRGGERRGSDPERV